MSQLQHLKIDVAKGVARVTLARPKHNVLNIEMMDELNDELRQLIDNSDLKCVVITGDGPSFCAGVEVADHKPEMVSEMIDVFNRIFELINRLEVPTIAAVKGACLGGGMEVAIACDIIYAAESAVFGQPEVKLGFFPPYAAVRLPQLVGVAKAIEICTTGRRYSALESQKLGFVSQVVDDDKFDEGLEKLIKELKMCSPLILRLNKKAVNKNLGKSFADGILCASEFFLNTLMKTDDTMEGIKSFEEKRRPEWKNS